MPDPITLDDLIDELEEWLKDVDDTLDSEPTDPMPEPVQQHVEQRLGSVGNIITQILDPNTAPSLSPPGAGSIDTTVSASTLKQYAQTTHQLGLEAKDEIHSGSPDYSMIGTRLKTIQHLLIGFEQAVSVA